MAKITNYSDKKTFTYAELWSFDPFVASTWYGASLPSEDKGDVYHLGARWKIDVIAACFVVWEDTSDGKRILRLANAGGVDQLGNPPAADFLPVYPGVNLIEFGASPEEPQPEPPAPTLPVGHVPHTITLYGANVYEPTAYWWGNDLVLTVPVDWYVEAWEAGPKKLLERLA